MKVRRKSPKLVRFAEPEAHKVEAQARKVRLQAKAVEAEALAKLCLGKVNLEVKEKLAAFEGSWILSASSKINCL